MNPPNDTLITERVIAIHTFNLNWLKHIIWDRSGEGSVKQGHAEELAEACGSSKNMTWY
jgi:hypothetical protein